MFLDVTSLELVLTEPQDEIRFMRIRTKRHEIMISPGTHLSPFVTSRATDRPTRVIPDERYLLAVLHDPAT